MRLNEDGAAGELALGFDDKRLALSAAVLSILGLLLLFYFAQQLAPKPVSLGQISAEREGSFLEVEGRIQGLSARQGNLFFNLCNYQNECVSVFFPVSSADDLALNPYLLKNNDRLVVRGQLKIYKGEPELIPSGPRGIELIG